jgi:NitT/TauT family transport system substrate-binding protein
LTAIAALWIAVVAALVPSLTPALAQDQVRIGLGYGFAFLPLYVCEDLKLVEKQAKAAHLDVAAKFQHFASGGELHAALAAGQIDIAPFGTRGCGGGQRARPPNRRGVGNYLIAAHAPEQSG